jgi:hypothetical protein
MEVDSSDEETETKPTKKAGKKGSKNKQAPAFAFDFDDGQVTCTTIP